MCLAQAKSLLIMLFNIPNHHGTAKLLTLQTLVMQVPNSSSSAHPPPDRQKLKEQRGDQDAFSIWISMALFTASCLHRVSQ